MKVMFEWALVNSLLLSIWIVSDGFLKVLFLFTEIADSKGMDSFLFCFVFTFDAYFPEISIQFIIQQCMNSSRKWEEEDTS